MSRTRAYRVLCGGLGGLFVLSGLVLVSSYFRALAPGGVVPGPLAVGPNGAYFMGFAGCATIAWGGGLLGVLRAPEDARTIGTASAFVLTLMAVMRILGWLLGDYAQLGNVLRVEAAGMLLLALAFVWLRPAARPKAALPPAAVPDGEQA